MGGEESQKMKQSRKQREIETIKIICFCFWISVFVFSLFLFGDDVQKRKNHQEKAQSNISSFYLRPENFSRFKNQNLNHTLTKIMSFENELFNLKNLINNLQHENQQQLTNLNFNLKNLISNFQNENKPQFTNFKLNFTNATLIACIFSHCLYSIKHI